MQRIFITGNAGTGKTTLAELLAKSLKISAVGLDKIVWQSGWKETPGLEKKEKIAEIIAPEHWIIEGVSKDVLDAADTIIFLDFPRRVSYLRVLKRNIKYLFKSRPGLPKNCPEILIIPRLIKIIWDFPNNVRPNITAHFGNNKDNKNTFHIRSNNDLNEMLSTHFMINTIDLNRRLVTE